MVKTPKVRHSKPPRQPVTIELGPDDVARADAAPEAGAQATAEAAATASADAPRYGYGFDEQPAKEPEGEAPAGDDTGGDAGNADGGRPAERAARGVGIGGRIAAGVVGGLVALLGAGALQYAGLLGAPGGGPGSASPDDMQGQIADLRSEITTLKNAGDGGLGTRVDGLSAALDQVKSDVLALKSGTESGGGDQAALSALSDKVAEVEKAVAALGQGGGAQPVDLGPLNEKIAALEALVKAAGEASGTQEGRIATLEQSVSQLSAKVDAQASQPKIALAIAAAALKSALERGAPFSAELDTFAAIAPDAPQVAALRAYAGKGVPTRAAIAGGMDAAADRMIAAARPADPDAGFFQQLLSSAESLVKVRPVGVVEGKGVPETVARMEVAVNQGDYAKALAEYDGLPEAAKAAGADFAALLKARLDAEAQLDSLVSDAMKA